MNCESTMDLRKSSVKLQALINDENAKQLSLLKQVLPYSEFERAARALIIDSVIRSKVPNAWNSFLEDTIHDMR